MFVRKKKNKSGSISVQIVDKSNGYRLVKTLGFSENPAEIDRLVKKAWHTISTFGGEQADFFLVKQKKMP